MASVVNLGQFGEPRESIMAPVAEGIKTGVSKGMETGAALRAALASEETKKRKQDMEMGENLLNDLAMYKADKSPQEWEMFKQTEHYKQVYDTLKGIFPERVDKGTKDILLPTPRDIYADKLEQHRAGIADKIARGESLTKADLALKDFLDKVDVRIVAAAIDAASKMDLWQTADELERAGMIQEQIRLLQQGRANIYTGSLGGGGGTPSPSVNSNDPLGILGD